MQPPTMPPRPPLAPSSQIADGSASTRLASAGASRSTPSGLSPATCSGTTSSGRSVCGLQLVMFSMTHAALPGVFARRNQAAAGCTSSRGPAAAGGARYGAQAQLQAVSVDWIRQIEAGAVVAGSGDRLVGVGIGEQRPQRGRRRRLVAIEGVARVPARRLRLRSTCPGSPAASRTTRYWRTRPRPWRSRGHPGWSRRPGR